MGHREAAGRLAASSSSSPRAEAHLPAGSEDQDCDNLHGDVNAGVLSLLPVSPSSASSSPPETPPPGRTTSPSPPPRRSLAPEPQPIPSSAPQFQPPRLPPLAAPRHQMTPPQPQRAPRGDASASSSSPPGTALYISGLPWWTTDAEVEAALAPHSAPAPALHDLFFYSYTSNGQSRGICRTDFLSPAAAASAATALNGRAFHGRNCVASLTRPPALNRLDHDSNAEPVQAEPNLSHGSGSLGTGRGATNATPVRGNVGPISGDRRALAPLPQQSIAPRQHGLPFGWTMGGGDGYGGFQPPGQFNSWMGTGMVPLAVAPHVNPAFLAAGGMARHGPGVPSNQVIGGGFWGAQPPWNFRGYQLPWQQPAPRMQAQQQQADGDMRRGRPGGSDERGIDSVRSFPGRRHSDNDGGDVYKDRDREERSRHRERAPEKEREPERHCDEGDRRRGNKRRHQESSEDDDDDRRVRARARSQSRNHGYDDHPRRHQESSEDDDDDRRVRARARNQSRNHGYDDRPRRHQGSSEDDDDDWRVRARARSQSRNHGYDDRRRRHQESSEDDDDDRRVRARARSQSRNHGYDDHPKRRQESSEDDDDDRRVRARARNQLRNHG